MRFTITASLLCAALLPTFAPLTRAATHAPISGEIQHIAIHDINDPWSGGTMVVGGQSVIIPANLLMDLPANRLSLQQLYTQAPAACQGAVPPETGLAKGDSCNATGTGGFATIAANRSDGGGVIAGDVFIEKARETVAGDITFINHTDGYIRVNGTPGSDGDGVVLRLNDPDSRHTVQQGLGCVPGSPNCSADPRFTLDPDNYTAAFVTGYPVCLPSTVPRTFTDALGLGTTTAQAAADGSGDVLCPLENRPAPGLPAADSRRFAPLMVGDSIAAEGSYEAVPAPSGLARFFSAHTLQVTTALTTRAAADQPDYMFLEEVEIDVPGFQNQRVRSLFIGFTTLAPADVVLWSIHYDPASNEAHEFPLASSSGCDRAAGAGECTGQGIGPGGIPGSAGSGDIFKMRYDVDFFAGVRVRDNPCAHLRADPRLAGLGICPNGGTAAEMFSILSPVPHEIQARTGRKIANPGLISLDINGAEATNGQYLFPLGVGLGGIGFPEFVEIDLNRVNTPFLFEGLPWNLDRRLSPSGCLDGNGEPGGGNCDGQRQALFPFPASSLDPRTQATLPVGPYGDSNYTASLLSDVRDRVLSYVTQTGGSGFNFNGDATRLLPLPTDPGIGATPVGPQFEAGCPTVELAGGAIPPPTPNVNTAPVITSTPPGSALSGQLFTHQVTATDAPGDLLLFSLVAAPTGMGIDPATGLIAWTPQGVLLGVPVIVKVADQLGASRQQAFSINVLPGGPGPQSDTVSIRTARFTSRNGLWVVNGRASTVGGTITLHLGALDGPQIGSAVVGRNGSWRLRARPTDPASIAASGDSVVAVSSGGGSILAPVIVR
jgi:hypothetical protein